METKEELMREHSRWTVKYVNADKHLKELLPPVANLSELEKMQPFIITEESLAEFERAGRDVETALNKLREIREKLSQLR
ncbi:hypothetical protein ES703_115597 [subsurface metagenome]